MDWKNLIAELQESGLTQTQIALACNTSQPYINELKNWAEDPSKPDKRPNPGYSIGAALVELHKTRCLATKRKRKSEVA